MSKHTDAFMFKCDLCGAPTQMGPHIYNGTTWPHYAMFVCKMCHEANWDGIGPAREPTFERHLNAKGIALPERNEKGWYPRDKVSTK